MEYTIDKTGKLLLDNTEVSGDLCLSGCTGLTALPDDLLVSGKIYKHASLFRRLLQVMARVVPGLKIDSRK